MPKKIKKTFRFYITTCEKLEKEDKRQKKLKIRGANQQNILEDLINKYL